MTGIERLRELVAGISPDIAVCGVTKTSYEMVVMAAMQLWASGRLDLVEVDDG